MHIIKSCENNTKEDQSIVKKLNAAKCYDQEFNVFSQHCSVQHRYQQLIIRQDASKPHDKLCIGDKTPCRLMEKSCQV